MRFALFALLTALTITISALPSTLTTALSDTTIDDTQPKARAITTGSQQRSCSSNADCIRQGLPLLRPRRGRSGQGRRQGPGASPLPPNLLQRRVAVLNAADGSFVGYLQRALDGSGLHYASASSADPLVVTINTANGNSQLNVITNTGGNLPYLCGVRGPFSSSDSISAGSSNYILFAQCDGPGTANAAPYKGQNSYNNAYSQETAIFNRDPNTNAFSAQWVNTDGSKPATFATIGPGNGRVGFTGDVDAFRNQYGTNRYQVVLRLDPL